MWAENVVCNFLRRLTISQLILIAFAYLYKISNNKILCCEIFRYLWILQQRVSSLAKKLHSYFIRSCYWNYYAACHSFIMPPFRLISRTLTPSFRVYLRKCWYFITFKILQADALSLCIIVVLFESDLLRLLVS